MMPSSVLLTIASSDDSTIDARWASAASSPLRLAEARRARRGTDARAPEDQNGSDDQRAHRVAEPPREPDRGVLAPVGISAERQGGHSDGRAHGRAEQTGQHHELEDVPRPVED